MSTAKDILDVVDIPSMEDEAWHFANDTVRQALTGIFGLAENILEYRRSSTFAHRKALYHARMVYSLEHATFRIVLRKLKLRRNRRLAMVWEAKAWAHDQSPQGIPNLAEVCCIPGPKPVKKAV